MDTDSLLKTEAVALLLNVKPKTVYAMVSKKAIPFVKIGGAVRFKRAALEAWINQRSVKVAV